MCGDEVSFTCDETLCKGSLTFGIRGPGERQAQALAAARSARTGRDCYSCLCYFWWTFDVSLIGVYLESARTALTRETYARLLARRGARQAPTG